MVRRRTLLAASAAMLTPLPFPAIANSYGPGVTDTEIKIGQSVPYSGNASAYGQNGRAEAAYMRMVNDNGGVNGRKINLISLDDGYSPPKTVELTRQLVERDQVLFLFATLGTQTNVAIHKYMNSRKVPHLFIASGASIWNDPKNYPWSMGFTPDYHTEGLIYAKHILKNVADPKIGILRQNDDFGRDYYNGFLQGLGDNGRKLLVSDVTYEVTDPTVDSQMLQLKSTDANVFFNITTPKFAAQAIRKAAEIGWKPTQYLVNVASSLGAAIRPAGIDNAQGIITAQYLKDVTDPRWANSPDVVAWRAWMEKYQPTANPAENANWLGYAVSFALVQVLKQCGDDLTRENVMKQAANLHNLEVPLLLPGIRVDTRPDDYAPIQAVHLARLEGEHWVLFGDLMERDAA